MDHSRDSCGTECRGLFWGRIDRVDEVLYAGRRIQASPSRHSDPDPNIETIYKLQELRQAKQKGEHTCPLSYLLEDFQDSFSTDWHNETYAFLGIANDHFDQVPIDYKRGRFGLYKDVIVFQNTAAQNVSEARTRSIWRNRVKMVHFSSLVRNLLSRTTELSSRRGLGTHFQLPNLANFVNYPIKREDLEWSRRDIRMWLPSKLEPPKTWIAYDPSEDIVVGGLPVGTIKIIGPSYWEFISTSSASRRWDYKLFNHNSDDSDHKKARGKLRGFTVFSRTLPRISNC